MIDRMILLITCGLVVALAAKLASLQPTNRRHERLLRHLRPAGERPTSTTRPVLDKLVTGLRSELAVTLVPQTPAQYLATITANATVLTTALLILIELLTPDSLLIFVTPLFWLIAVGLQRLTLLAAAQQMRTSLRDDLPLLLSELQTSLERGNSLTTSLIGIAETTQTSWRAHLVRCAASLVRGEAVANVLTELAGLAGIPEVRRALELLALSWQHQVAQKLIAQLLAQAKLDHHNRLIAIAGKREQLIWIPVAIATLIPGVLLVIVPLVGSLRLLALH